VGPIVEISHLQPIHFCLSVLLLWDQFDKIVMKNLHNLLLNIKDLNYLEIFNNAKIEIGLTKPYQVTSHN